jgi:uncharacterized Fe-S cluster-containing radical SAM superfamily protein
VRKKLRFLLFRALHHFHDTGMQVWPHEPRHFVSEARLKLTRSFSPPPLCALCFSRACSP